MRKAKRIVALVLALTLLFALAAMTASAANARGVTCINCGSGKTNNHTRTVTISQRTVSGCSSVQGYHLHLTQVKQSGIRCNDCKYMTVLSTGSEYEVCVG